MGVVVWQQSGVECSSSRRPGPYLSLVLYLTCFFHLGPRLTLQTTWLCSNFKPSCPKCTAPFFLSPSLHPSASFIPALPASIDHFTVPVSSQLRIPTRTPPAMDDHELEASQTEGYKVGEKKTIDEFTKLDADDEALNKWKASLLASGKPVGDPNDPRTVVIEEIALIVDGRPDIAIDLTEANALEDLKSKPFTLKEGCEYRMRIKFRVQHEVISGLKYIHVVKRKGIKVDKSEEMMGSYGPNTDAQPVYSKLFATEEAPAGMLARGSYTAITRFIDDDKKDHLTYNWAFDIKKDW
ncbi:hypothetical protein ABW21_db0202738 [Orbilia brochopaga]|nr:hypothetical protein ABW21_db0202738 [Drechslerella brochopaga]